MLKNLKKFSQKIFEIIFPNRCLTCRQMIGHGGIFCNEDWKKLQFITDPKCNICAHPFDFSYDISNELLCPKCLQNRPAFDSTAVIFCYNEQIKKIIFDLKYYDATHLSNKFSELILAKLKDELPSYDLIIAVPLHKNRLRQRKFNQSVLLARAILKHTKNLKFYPDILVRKKYTQAQAKLTQKERLQNLQNSFEINPKYKNTLKDKNILLIDDVMTTGATAENCARVLKEYGCGKIKAVAIAKAVLKT